MDTYIIAYDIHDHARLAKVTKAMSEYGARRQYSIFECRLSEMALLKLRLRLEKIINAEDDQVMIVKLCPRCLNGIQTIGLPRVKEPETFKIF